MNVEHMMAFVDEQRNEGNSFYKKGKHSEALAAWQSGLDAIAQAEDKPIARKDVEILLRARSTLHSNRGQALMTMQFWRRAITDLDSAVKLDPANAKALWRRYKCHRELKHWAEAEADLEALLKPELQQAAGPLLEAAGLTAATLVSTREELQQKRQAAEAEAEATFDDRLEEAAHKGLEQMRERFEEVTKRNGLHGNAELSGELAEMIMRPGGVDASFVANVYQIDDDDAQILIDWISKAVQMRDEVGYETMDAI